MAEPPGRPPVHSPGAPLSLGRCRIDQVVVGMDVGVFIPEVGTTTWNTLGSGLPHAVADDLSMDPNGHTILVATHGRGIWSVDLS